LIVCWEGKRKVAIVKKKIKGALEKVKKAFKQPLNIPSERKEYKDNYKRF